MRFSLFITLALIAGIAFALGVGDCPSSYCENGVLYSECYYSQSDYSCSCTTIRGCPFGCNASAPDAACNLAPVVDARCPDQCYDTTLHYGGWWSDANTVCMSYTLTCPFGCKVDHTGCIEEAPTPVPTPTPIGMTPTPRPTATPAPTPTPQITPEPTPEPTPATTPEPTPAGPIDGLCTTSAGLVLLSLAFASTRRG